MGYFNFISRIYLLSILLALFYAGCLAGPEDNLVLPSLDAYYLNIAKAWISFESRDYNKAITLFREASNIDPLRPQAYLGMGWGYAMTDKLVDSLFNLELAIMREPGSPDGYAAKAFVYLAMDNYKDSITAAEKAISLGKEDYVFNQIPDVRTRNLRLLIAECFYNLGQYQNAQAQINILDPSNNLNQNSRDYKRDLLLEIEKLKPDQSILENIKNETL